MGAYFGLVPRKYQSGKIDRTGRITEIGDAMARSALFEAANVMLSRTLPKKLSSVTELALWLLV